MGLDLYPANSLNNSPTNASFMNSEFVSDLTKTSGMAGAKSLITRPNTRSVAFDADDNVFYVIETDISNNKNVTRYRFVPEPEPKPEDIFATKEEIRELKGELNNVQQSIWDLTETITKAFNTTANTAADVQSNSGSTGNNKKFISKSKGENKPNGNFANANGQQSSS